MKEIKEMIENFSRAEALAQTRYKIPDLTQYNEAVEDMYSYTTDLLYEGLWIMTSDELEEDEEFYEEYKDSPPVLPRHLFKISRYTHKEWGDVWAAFVSEPKPGENFKILGYTLFVVKEDNNLRIAAVSIYSDYGSDGLRYEWGSPQGDSSLRFSNLKGPLEIERYQEPAEDFDGLKIFNEDI